MLTVRCELKEWLSLGPALAEAGVRRVELTDCQPWSKQSQQGPLFGPYKKAFGWYGYTGKSFEFADREDIPRDVWVLLERHIGDDEGYRFYHDHHQAVDELSSALREWAILEGHKRREALPVVSEEPPLTPEEVRAIFKRSRAIQEKNKAEAEALHYTRVCVERVTGRVLVAYFGIRSGVWGETVEVVEGRVFADYDADGRLLGLEMLSPCDAAFLDRFEPEVRDFVRKSAPACMLL